MASAKNLPAVYRKLVAVKLSQKFREAAQMVTANLPTPAADEIIIKNRFVGINASDINFTAGRYFTDAQPPFDIGFEGVGEVVAKGDKCGDIKIGQPVAFMKNGAFSEYISLERKMAIPLPMPQAKPEVISLLVSGMTAAISLDKVGEVKAGENVLVTAAAGGTGQFAVQWAKKAGCHVIGTCSTDEKVELLKSIGCDRAINTNKENLREVLRKEYKKGVDVVYETIGGEVFDACVDNLAKKGRLVVIGYITGYESESGLARSKTGTLPAKLLAKSCSIRGFMLFDYADQYKAYLGKLLTGYLDGSIKITVDNGVNDPRGPFKGLDSIANAVEYLYSRKSRGKIVVEIPDQSAKL